MTFGELNQDAYTLSSRLTGVNEAEFINLYEKDIEIVAGRSFTEQELETGANVLILNSAYDQSGEHTPIEVGDQLHLDMTIYAPPTQTEQRGEQLYQEQISFEVIGLHDTLPTVRDLAAECGTSFGCIEERIFMPNQTLLSLYQKVKTEFPIEEKDQEEMFGQSLIQLGVKASLFVLDTAESLSIFEPQAKEAIQNTIHSLKEDDLIDEENDWMVQFKLVTSDQHYQSTAETIENISLIAKASFFGSIIAMTSILTVIILLFLRDRSKEMGLLRALGERKHRLLGQILLEVSIITILALSLSLITGQLLANQLATSIFQTAEPAAITSTSDQMITTIIDSTTIAFDGQYVFMVYLVGITTILLAIIFPMIYLLKLNPKKILMKH